MEVPQNNVYELLAKIHELIGDEHKEPSAMDKGEYQILHSRLVQGSLELFQHLAAHDVIFAGNDEHSHAVEPQEIRTIKQDDDAFSEVAVNIHVSAIAKKDDGTNRLAAHIIDENAIADSADLLVLMKIWTDLEMAEGEKNERLTEALFDRWTAIAERVRPRAIRTLEQLQTAGLLLLYDIRAKTDYNFAVEETDDRIYLLFSSFLPTPQKKPTTSRSKRRTAQPKTPKA